MSTKKTDGPTEETGGAFVVLGIVFMVLSIAMDGNAAFLAPGIAFLVVGLVRRNRRPDDADSSNTDDSETPEDG